MAEKVPLLTQIMSVGLARELILKCDLIAAEKRESFAAGIDAALATLDFVDRQADEIRAALTFYRAAQEASGG